MGPIITLADSPSWAQLRQIELHVLPRYFLGGLFVRAHLVEQTLTLAGSFKIDSFKTGSIYSECILLEYVGILQAGWLVCEQRLPRDDEMNEYYHTSRSRESACLFTHTGLSHLHPLHHIGDGRGGSYSSNHRWLAVCY